MCTAAAAPSSEPGAEWWEFCGEAGWVRDNPDPEATPFSRLEMGMIVQLVARVASDGFGPSLRTALGLSICKYRFRRLSGHVPSEHLRLRYFRAYVPALDKLLWLGPIKDVVHTVVWLDPTDSQPPSVQFKLRSNPPRGEEDRRESYIPPSAYIRVLNCPDAKCARLDTLLCPGICAAKLAGSETAAAAPRRGSVTMYGPT